MQIVIDIPEEMKAVIDRNGTNELVNETLWQAVKNGTSLPKGHGKLIDADKLNRTMYHKAFETDSDMQKWDSGCWIRYKMFENSMEEMQTIIEADKESEE